MTTCGYCGKPIPGQVFSYVCGIPYHIECTQGPGYVQRTYQPASLTEENMRKIIREELSKCWNDAIEAAAALVAEKYDEQEPWITPEEIRMLKVV